MDLDKLLATVEKAARVNPFAVRGGGVPESPELDRIAGLPARNPEPPSPEVCAEFSALFRAPGGTWNLWPSQVQALLEMASQGGLFAPIQVGGGKTAITFLAPSLLGAKRPLLLIPAHLKEKTRRDFQELWHHFNGFPPNQYRIESYQKLATATQAEMLHRYQPDLIVTDEAQALKSTRSACTRRIKRYLESPEGEHCKFVTLSGSFTKRSIMDYFHLIRWALRHGSPVPRSAVDAQPWADAIDEKSATGKRCLPGALVRLAKTAEEIKGLDILASAEDRLRTARTVYRRRLTTTRGVVSTAETNLATALLVREWNPGPDGCNAHWSTLRSAWQLPDGQDILDAVHLWRHAKEMALGFFYRWETPGPVDWMDARREWGKYCRKLLKHSDRFDTELQAIWAVDHAEAPNWKYGAATLHNWRALKPKFVPVTHPEWLSSAVVNSAAHWMANNPRGIVWVEHGAFGLALSKATGANFYQEGGFDPRAGKSVMDARPGYPFIASIRANGTGRNLQAWNQNLLTACPPTGATMEQLLGRTHRPGQTAADVSVDILAACWENVNDVDRVLRDARYIQATTGAPQKLCAATVDFPELEEIEERTGARWRRHGTAESLGAGSEDSSGEGEG